MGNNEKKGNALTNKDNLPKLSAFIFPPLSGYNIRFFQMMGSQNHK